jgi:hypothetical protein
MTGVWPLGAQVVRVIGVSETPDSSKKQMTALRRLALFYPGPVLSGPGSDCFLVALPGPPGGTPQAPAKLAPEQLPDVGGMVADPGRALDDGGDAPQSPQFVVDAVGHSALE